MTDEDGGQPAGRGLSKHAHKCSECEAMRISTLDDIGDCPWCGSEMEPYNYDGGNR